MREEEGYSGPVWVRFSSPWPGSTEVAEPLSVAARLWGGGFPFVADQDPGTWGSHSLQRPTSPKGLQSLQLVPQAPWPGIKLWAFRFKCSQGDRQGSSHSIYSCIHSLKHMTDNKAEALNGSVTCSKPPSALQVHSPSMHSNLASRLSLRLFYIIKLYAGPGTHTN